MAARRIRIHIAGQVQGVYYRATAQQEARRLGITGWVRNEGDGSVILEAQGEEESLEQLLAWTRRGPELAKVTQVNIQERERIPGEGAFEIRPDARG